MSWAQEFRGLSSNLLLLARSLRSTPRVASGIALGAASLAGWHGSAAWHPLGR